MNRPIKFRIFLAGKFYYWGFLDDGHGMHFAAPPTITSELLSFEEIQERTEQFTGLFDKHGKEIWEGDILKSRSGLLFLIEWGGIGFISPWIARLGSMPSGGWELSEVIGNIFENPELLEKKS